MNKMKKARRAAQILSVPALLLVCLAVSYILAYMLVQMTASLMGYAAWSKPTPAFLLVVLPIWLLFLLSIKRYAGVLQWFKMEHARKETIVRGAVVTIAVLAILIGCGALASLFTRILYFTVGFEPPERFVPGRVLNLLLFILLLLLVRHYLKRGNFAKHIDLLAAVIRVVESIAKGDYKARMEDKFRGNESFGQLVNSVNRMAADLERLENMRQEFVSNVSHEIRSPLASIRGFAQVLQRDDSLSADERNLYVGIIEAESARLSKLSDNLLQLAVLEAEDMRLEVRPYRLDRQLRDLILACEPQWRGKRIGMEASLEEVTVTADEDRMSQVWINLLHNSIKFTPEGGTIRVEVRPRGETVDVLIADTGIGIAEEDRQRIFERFYKADKSRDRSNSGSGLGLSIVNKIIGLHGGRIRVQSEPGAGTTFTVSLPSGSPRTRLERSPG